MRALFAEARDLATSTSRAPVLLYGETGTGKEVLARYMHQQSAPPGPFVPVNCGALSPDLAESRLFGHEKGSYTGAVRQRHGYFRQAHGGVLLLDQVESMPEAVQVMLLRVLEDGEIYSIGAERPQQVTVRVIATMNRPAPQLMQEGKLREDLYYRLSAYALTIPPLRERRADIVPLAQAFLRQQGSPADMDEAAQVALGLYAWPGNIRELHHVLLGALRTMRAMRATTIRHEHISLCEPGKASASAIVCTAFDDLARQLLGTGTVPALLRQLRQSLIAAALEATNGNVRHAGKLLGIHAPNVYRYLPALRELHKGNVIALHG
jgi:transcriptional regulator with PAS, ATPase and Fis domain